MGHETVMLEGYSRGGVAQVLFGCTLFSILGFAGPDRTLWVYLNGWWPIYNRMLSKSEHFFWSFIQDLFNNGRIVIITHIFLNVFQTVDASVK